MDFGTDDRRPRAESVVPMINVVFLLLIFFLMTATIAPPEPFDISPPESVADDIAEAEQPLFVAADGRIAWGELQGDAAVVAVAAARAGRSDLAPLTIKADEAVKGPAIARLLKQLATAGVTESQLIAVAVD